MPASPARRLGLAYAAAVIGALGLVPPVAAQMPTRVLFLHSYHPGYQWTDDIEQGVIETLREAGGAVETRAEYLDTIRASPPEVLDHVRDLLAVKYEAMPPRVLVATDDAAVEFLLANPSLFSGIPVVFGGVNESALAGRVPRTRFTGVIELFRMDGLVDMAVRLRPDTRRIVVVTGATLTSDALRQLFEALAPQRPALGFLFLSGRERSFAAITAALAKETRDTDVVVASPVIADVTGQRLGGERESIAAIVAASRAPVISPTVDHVGQGLLAGSVNTGRNHGRRVGRKVLQVLAGTAVESISIDDDAEMQFVVDAQQLARWGIAERLLPPGAVVANRAASFYRANKALIWGAAAFMVVQSLIIGLLVVNVRRRRQAERVLEGQARALAASNADLAAVNRSLVQEQDVRLRTEAHLRQAQKMEAVGRLAGGVAHDFNNLLTVIAGYAELLLNDLPAGPPREGADQIRRASEQAAALTQNLLAFSRKQVFETRLIDLSQAVADVEPMLRTLIGENITVDLRLHRALPLVRTGEGQIEQVVLNLVINARDAMPEGGGLVIETRPVALAAPPPDHPDLPPGRYAMLSVTDTGVGIDAETRAFVFEPFFTTKSMGKGTGLGLATVYGIVTQHGGSVSVASEPGRGATFTLLLPECRNAMVAPARRAVVPAATGAGETLLVVEDEPEVRVLAARVLRQAGYHVLEATCGDDATAVRAAHPGRVDLLLSDIVMPGENGFVVARRLGASCPGLKVVFMSGYADDRIERDADVDASTLFLRKPFLPSDLLARVRDALGDAGPAPSPSPSPRAAS